MRVRVKELAQEAKYIRLEETKIKSKQKIVGDIWDNPDVKSLEFWKLRNHRTHDVRDAARAIQLAYGFMRDVPYRRIEQTTKPKDPYRWNRIVKEVKRLANKFSNSEKKFDEDVDIWFASDRIDEQKG